MTVLQNPEIPQPVSATGIDAAIQEILLRLNTNLDWLTNGYARAYRFFRTQDGRSMYFPEVYIGKQNGQPAYSRVTPDNDKKGSCFFVVSSERVIDSKPNGYSYSTYNVGLCFSVNLDLINSGLLATEIITENLIEQVKAVLHRRMQGIGFEVKITTIDREQSQIYKDFVINNQENYLRAPLSGFRLNLEVKVQESCDNNINIFQRCAALANSITYEDLINCLLPTFGIVLNSDVQHLQQLTPLNVIGNNQLASNNPIEAGAVVGTALFFHVNHRLYRISRGIKTELAYFSNDGGLTAKSNIEIGDKLYINALNLGFTVNNVDTLEVSFTKTQVI